MECSLEARLLFIGLWNFCDDAGNHPLSDRTIKALVFPGDDINSTTIRRLLAELSTNGLLRFYEASGKHYLNVPGWRHQKIDKPTVKHPEFDPDSQVSPDEVWPAGQSLDEYSTSIRRVFDEPSPPEGKGKGKEKIKSTVEQPEKPDPIPYAKVMGIYQATCAGVFLGAEKLTAGRKIAIKRAWHFKAREKCPFQDLEFWQRYFERCKTNRHWCGENDRGWKADLEFVLREANIVKVLGV